MARIPISPNGSIQAQAIVRQLTGEADFTVPTATDVARLGTTLETSSHYLSVQAASEIGFSFGDASSAVDYRVLVLDYWWTYEQAHTSRRNNLSFVFGAGFRVGVRFSTSESSASLSLGMLAATAQVQHKDITVQVLRAGLPRGPSVPPTLATASELDVDKYASLMGWQTDVVKYFDEHRSEAAPVLVALNVVINGQALLGYGRGVLFALWRIFKGSTLQRALELRKESEELSPDEVSEEDVRAVYAGALNEPEYLIGQGNLTREPNEAERRMAEGWLFKYKNV